MPFHKQKDGTYKSPSGRTFTPKQVKMYYATGGFRPSLVKSYKSGRSIVRNRPDIVRKAKV